MILLYQSNTWICTHYFRFDVTRMEKHLRILHAIPVFYKNILWDIYSASGGIKLVNFVYFMYMEVYFWSQY